MTKLVETKVQSGICLITLKNPPVNALNYEVRGALEAAVRAANDNPQMRAIVLLGEGRCFSGGADIKEFGKPRIKPFLTDLCNQLEACSKPVIAAIHGVAVGGGTELSLGCHYRIGDESARIGLPEVKLGQIPGAGGAQRLPRVIGFAPALDVILSGDQVSARRAKDLGFFDEIVSNDIAAAALEFALLLVAKGQGPRPTRNIGVDAEAGAQAIAEARAKLAKSSRGLVAPGKCVDAVERALKMPIDEALTEDRKSFDELTTSEQGRAQRHLFFAQRLAEKLQQAPQAGIRFEVKRVGIVGCGTMGRGIAASVASGGFEVVVVENDAERLHAGLSEIQRLALGRKTDTGASVNAALRVTGAQQLSALVDVDVVIEAAFEDMKLKKEIFAALSGICKRDAILATNTSTLDINEIASVTANPSRVVGAHFFSPAHANKLLEIIRGYNSSPEVLAAMGSLAKRINKIPVIVGVCPGFVGNRMLYAYRSQAEFMLEEGALPQDVDGAIGKFGFLMGPFAVGDLSGLDVGYRARKQQTLLNPSPARYSSTIADRIVEMGRLGQKTSKGWYRYEEGSRKPFPDEEVAQVIENVSKEHGIRRRQISEDEIRDRCIYALINEGARILGEGVAQRPSDIDIIWTVGYGFPVGKGGPMFYADQLGLGTVLDALIRLRQAHGDELQPAPLLKRLVEENRQFSDLNT